MFPAKKTPAESKAYQEIAIMNRRPLALLVLVIASMVASACADVTAPRHDDPYCSGYTDSSGRCITP